MTVVCPACRFVNPDARLRGDLHATDALSTRRVQLLPEGTAARAETELKIVRVLFETGDFERAAELVDDATRVAEQLGDERLAALALFEKLMLSTLIGGTAAAFDPKDLEVPAATLERVGDEIGLASAQAYLGRDARDWRRWEAAAMFYGPTPVRDVIAFLDELIVEDAREGVPSATSELVKAASLAMAGELEKARGLVREAAPVALELGIGPMGMVGMLGGHVELLAGAPEAAVELLQVPWARYGEVGETGFRSTVGTMLAEAMVAAGRDAQADAVLAEVEIFAGADDFDPQARLRWVRALILARRGDFDEAERLAREGVAITRRTDYLAGHRGDEAQTGWRDALDLYERKGAVLRADQARERLR
jgi:tetratricopeptide (TPR) repeat protein